VASIDDVTSEFFVRLDVLDKPGVLARITSIFARNNIGISHVLQPRGGEGQIIPLVLLLHRAPNGAVAKALKQIAGQPLVKGKPVRFRVERFV
jgi:homoserine dehydrogenase